MSWFPPSASRVSQHASSEAMSSASQKTLIDQQQTASSGVQYTISPGSRETLLARLENEISQFKLDHTSIREPVMLMLLQEELARLREENLIVRADLRLAQEKYQALESEHRRYKNQKREVMETAIKILSAGLELPKEASVNLGLTTQGVVPGASLSPLQSVSDPVVKKASDTPSAFQAGVTGSTGGGSPGQGNILGQHPIPSSVAQPFVFPPSASQKDQPNALKSLLFDLASSSTPSSFRSLATAPSPVTREVASSPFPSMYGDPGPTIQRENGNIAVFKNTPGSHNSQEQSFEEARLRRYESRNAIPVVPLPPKWLGSIGLPKDSTPHTLLNSASSFQGFQQSNMGKVGEEGGCREGQASNSGSMDTAGGSKPTMGVSSIHNATPLNSDSRKGSRSGHTNLSTSVDDGVKTEAEQQEVHMMAMTENAKPCRSIPRA